MVTPTLVATTPAPDLPTLTLSVAPNPADGRATAWIEGATGPATVAVFDALGRRVAVAFKGEIRERTAVELPVSRFAPGVYGVRLSTVNGVRTVRLVVAR
jgi:hypothetical protein